MSKLKLANKYIYSLDDLIGKGATCEVYKGINKVTGEIHALKIFGTRVGIIAQREIEALRSLKHENIVDFVGQETEDDSGRVVAVMEYCDTSLFAALCEPENRCGLPEDEFMRFFTHIVAGMKHLREHGFLHRDIKPGNILIVQDDYGSNIYKLSDFGTAKPVMATEAFQSLVGTEEYLHPNIFGVAFINNAMPREFDATADLWSLGATLYHAATGKVPFQPYHGRADRQLMFKMITQKKHGDIAGEQKTDKGEVIWTKELPKSCRLSRWLKLSLTKILQCLLASDPALAMTFDSFFEAANDIIFRRMIYVFSTTSTTHFRLYMKPDCIYSDLQQEIYDETNIPPKEQHIYYEECLLSDIIKDTDSVQSYPKFGMHTPLVLIQSTTLKQHAASDVNKFWYSEEIPVQLPTFSDKIRIKEDLHKAKSVCVSIALIQIYIDQGCLTQELFEKTIRRTERWKEVLVNRLQMEVNLYRDRVKDICYISAAITENGGREHSVLSDGVSIQDLKGCICSCINRMKKIQDTQTNIGNQLYISGCMDRNQCQKKIVRLLQQAKDMRNIFETRSKAGKPLPFHEEQLHKFDRTLLQQIFQKALGLWTSHCQKKITEFHSYFLEWHCIFTNLQMQIEVLQKDIYKVKSAIKKYVKYFKVSSPTMTIDDCSQNRNSSTCSNTECQVPVMTSVKLESKQHASVNTLDTGISLVSEDTTMLDHV